MDEGFNTFINSLSSSNFNNGEYKSKYPQDKNRIGAMYTAPGLEPILTYVDNYKERKIKSKDYPPLRSEERSIVHPIIFIFQIRNICFHVVY